MEHEALSTNTSQQDVICVNCGKPLQLGQNHTHLQERLLGQLTGNYFCDFACKLHWGSKDITC